MRLMEGEVVNDGMRNIVSRVTSAV